MKPTVLAVVGTRPDAVKMSPVIRELGKREGIECRVISSGQHSEMLDTVLAERGIAADISLRVMREGQSLTALTERLFVGIRSALEKERADIVAVHGDTTTALVAALVAFSQGIPVAHVEAGLRSGDLKSPYPEEMNRRAIALLADLHFAPSESSAENLYREGVPKGKVFVTGNTVYDALADEYDPSFSHSVLEWAGARPFAILTAHRRESRGRLDEILLGVRDALEECGALAVFPVHPSKETAGAARRVFEGFDGVRLLPPLPPHEFQNLLARCSIAITDSGGVQEEAPFFGKTVVVLRDKTERIDGLARGDLLLAGTERESVRSTICSVLRGPEKYGYGDKAKSRAECGAASKIADIICDELGVSRLRHCRTRRLDNS